MLMNKPSPPRPQRGITLIESLVALVVAALGILGIAGVQMRTLTDTGTTVRRAQAIRLIEDLAERMKVNPNALINIERYTSPYQEKAENLEVLRNCRETACSPDEQSSYDIHQWKTMVERSLPLGRASLFLAPGELEDSNRRQIGVIIAWRENERSDLSREDIDFTDASKMADGSGGFISWTDEENACPEGYTCHLQYIPASARCAPYGLSGLATMYCS